MRWSSLEFSETPDEEERSKDKNKLLCPHGLDIKDCEDCGGDSYPWKLFLYLVGAIIVAVLGMAWFFRTLFVFLK